ncbi:MAG: hypothetical protein ACAI35_24420 [Candidatus Methylacidiphilales bacterium]
MNEPEHTNLGSEAHTLPGDSTFFSLRTASFQPFVPASLPNPEEVNLAASRLMKRGIALMEEPRPANELSAALNEAVSLFDQAIAMRNGLPIQENHWYRYVLIACWLNRGDALTRLGILEPEGKVERIHQALHAFDAGLDLLSGLPLNLNPLYPRRYAIAWINRGFALQQLWHIAVPATSGASESEPKSAPSAQSVSQLVAAAGSFRNAMRILAMPESEAIEDLVALQIGSRLNLCSALVDVPAHIPGAGFALTLEAYTMAKEALELCAPLEQDHIDIATVSLRVSHALCRVIAHGLTDPSASTAATASATEGWMSEATDLVDDGMALARHWEQRGDTQLRPLAQDLFRFGCRIYSTHLPHFLAEFVQENLDASVPGAHPFSPAIHNAALIAVWRAWQEIERTSFASINTPRFEQLLADLRELRVTEDRLEAMRRQATEEGLIAPPVAPAPR